MASKTFGEALEGKERTVLKGKSGKKLPVTPQVKAPKANDLKKSQKVVSKEFVESSSEDDFLEERNSKRTSSTQQTDKKKSVEIASKSSGI